MTPVPRTIRPVTPTGIATLDELLHGGLPLGTITEVAGPESSGRTALALAFLAQVTAEAKVCAWVDVADSLDPESTAAAGVSLNRMLWVRCGVSAPRSQTTARAAHLPASWFTAPPIKKGLCGRGGGPHPRREVKGLSVAVGSFLGPRCAEPQPREPRQRERIEPLKLDTPPRVRQASAKPLSRIDQALRVTDLLLQAGGFSAIVLDLGGIAPEHALRIPVATWFRYRAAAERTQAAILLLTQHACAKSSAGLLLRMEPGTPRADETVFTGISHRAEVVRERFEPVSNLVQMRKPPQVERRADWQTRTSWAGVR